MPDERSQPILSIIVHLPNNLPYSLKNFYDIISGIFQQREIIPELIILDQQLNENVTNEISSMNINGYPLIFINEQFSTLGAWLNAARARATSDFLLYIDNRAAEVYLRSAASSLFLLSAERNPEAGLIYSDYAVKKGRKTNEIHLLKPHHGRLRDNQDYGAVLFFRQSSLVTCGGFDESLEFNTLYDIRLKLMEESSPVHISNRYAGELYHTIAQNKGHNVFDYLLASKESQKEAEDVLTNHLKKINCYLAPSRYYSDRLEEDIESKLKATIIIPVNNRPNFITTAIESVLRQSVQEIEIIVVVNGGDDDPTNDAVKTYMPGGKNHIPGNPDVRLITVDINNIGFCLNLGARNARGKYYIQLDSDDRLKKDAVEKILNLFESDARIGIVIGSYEVWEKDNKTGDLSRVDSIPVVTHDEWTEENGRNNLLRINGAGAPRSIPINMIKQMGYFGINDEPFARNYGEDYEMVLKISERYKVGRIWDPIYEVVRHKGGTDHSIDNATIDRNDEAKDYMRLQALERRRKLSAVK